MQELMKLGCDRTRFLNHLTVVELADHDLTVKVIGLTMLRFSLRCKGDCSLEVWIAETRPGVP